MRVDDFDLGEMSGHAFPTPSLPPAGRTAGIAQRQTSSGLGCWQYPPQRGATAILGKIAAGRKILTFG
jgi:hypothetical protein